MFHEPGRRQLQDIVTCVRTKTTIDDVVFERERHADRFLKPPEEMERLFRQYPEAPARTMEIVIRCHFSLVELSYHYPEEAIVPGMDAQQSLEHYVRECIPNRYPGGLPEHVEKMIRHELGLLCSYCPGILDTQPQRRALLRQQKRSNRKQSRYGTHGASNYAFHRRQSLLRL
jgi:error-prone DNA polymerase